MSETTKEPKWMSDIKTATEQWHKADPEKRSVITIAVGEDENGDVTVNGSIIGHPLHLAMGITAIMNEDSDENPVGSILRMAAMKHLAANATEIGTFEINLGDKDDEQEEPHNTESHE